MNKLTKSEFYSVYGISLLMNTAGPEELYNIEKILIPIAEKYRDITLYALRAELRYFIAGSRRINQDEYLSDAQYKSRLSDQQYRQHNNKELLKEMNLEWGRETRKNLSISKIERLFREGHWAPEYGGEAWSEIAMACENLAMELDKTPMDCNKVVMCIDRLNDLEHNNALYLESYSTFSLGDELYNKGEVDTDSIIKQSCIEVRKIYNTNKRLMGIH